MARASETTAWKEALPPAAARLLERFLAAGARLVLVGPTARAFATGEDIAQAERLEFLSDCEGRQIESLARSTEGLRPAEGRRRGLVLVDAHEPGRAEITIRPLRRERREPAGSDPIVQDLATREITIHALAIDERGQLIDPYGALSDLRAGRLRAIPPVERLRSEHPRWMLRMARHVAYYGFDPAPEIVRIARARAADLLDLPRELWREEMERALLHVHPHRALDFLQQAGLLAVMLPEVEALVGFHETCPVHHKDIWEHTRLVVQRAQPTPLQRWTALLHDVGKYATRTVGPDGEVHFLRHEELSGVLFDGVAARLRFPTPLAERVGFLIRNHSRVNLYNEEWTDSAVRRLVRELGEDLEELLAFSRADITSRREERVERLLRLMDELTARVARAREDEAYEAPLPKGIGSLLIERFALSPGPAVGALRKRLAQAVEDGALPRGLPAEDYVEKLAEWLAAEG